MLSITVSVDPSPSKKHFEFYDFNKMGIITIKDRVGVIQKMKRFYSSSYLPGWF